MVDDIHWKDGHSEPKEAPDIHEQASTGVGEVRDCIEVEGDEKVALDELLVEMMNEVDAGDEEEDNAIEKVQGNCMRTEVVDMDHKEQEVVAWDVVHEVVMVVRNSTQSGVEVDNPYVEVRLAIRNAVEALIIDCAWVAYRLNQHPNRALMTFASTWPLVFLPVSPSLRQYERAYVWDLYELGS